MGDPIEEHLAFEFLDVRVDVAGRELWRGGESVRVEPQVFDLLVHLMAHHDRVVSKLELYDAIWEHRFVSESALTTRVKMARRAIGDSGRSQRMIRTVHGKGYRFVAPLLQADSESAAAAHRTQHRSVADPLAGLAEGRGLAVWVDGWTSGGAFFLRDLLERAVVAGFPTGHGSARRSSMRPYGSLIDALDELLQRHSDLLEALPETLRSEIEGVLAGGMPSRRQRWVLAVRELIVASARRCHGLVIVLDGIDHADLDSLDAIEFLGDLTTHHPVVVAVGAKHGMPVLARFEHRETTTETETDPPPLSLPDDAAEALQLVSLLEQPFDLESLSAALVQPIDTCLRFLDICEGLDAIEPVGSRYAVNIDRLHPDHTLAHRRRGNHRLIAGRLAEAGLAPHHIAHHLIEGGDLRRSVPYVIQAAGARIEAGLHREALAWIDSVLPDASGVEAGQLHALRGDALLASGDPAATVAYRQAVRFAEPERISGLRVRLARSALVTGDLASAAEALAGIEPTGSPSDAEILLLRGMLAYFSGDLDTRREGRRGRSRFRAQSRGPRPAARCHHPSGNDRSQRGSMERSALS